ncbi:unnamed protein product [Orchesella dallaii]|uniref:Prolyl endopeptidase n=1 Tax=Orchesella dallaii TaxID=48710 RepID=A0ABP1PYR2_9HEXA
MSTVSQCFLKSKEEKLGKLVVAFHRLGTDQTHDLIFVEFLDPPHLTLQAQISDCGELLFVYVNENNSNQHCHLLYGHLKGSAKQNYEMTPHLFHLVEGDGLDIQFITQSHGATYFRTNCRAPNFRIVKTYLIKGTKLTKGFWETIVSEDPKRLLDWAVCVNKHFLLICYLQDSSHNLQLHKLLDGTLLYKYSLPKGTITEYSGGSASARFFFTFSSFLTPDCVRYIEIPQYSSKRWRNYLNFKLKDKRMKYFNKDIANIVDTSDCCMKQRCCVSPTDGADIPIFLIHKKWYRDGTLRNKQQTYSDVIAASEFLIKLGYTSNSKLIIEGQQFGGNLAAACLVQRPDLFGAVIIHNGLMDLLRYHLFKESQNYITEFGDPNQILNFENLTKISPLHNVLNENTLLKIPAVMAIVDKGGSLAHASNSYKFIAELQFDLASKSTTVSLTFTDLRLSSVR